MYLIGQVAEMFGLPISTLRYYDKQGLFPNMERVSGIRKFGETEIEALRVIECLKKAGMEIKDIRQFMDWCVEGPVHLSAAQNDVSGAESAHRGRNQAHDPDAGYAPIQVLVLRTGHSGRQRRKNCRHAS